MGASNEAVKDGALDLRRKAVRQLILATLFWGLSFPLIKTIAFLQQAALPGGSSWFYSAAGISLRFGSAAILLMVWTGRPGKFTKLELQQGVGLGVFGGLGLIFQVDGLAYTSASVSAFLTQAYCLIIPLVVAVRDRQRPRLIVMVSCMMMIVGVGILAGVDWRSFRLGRGELETLIASFIFTGQILLLEHPAYRANNVTRFSFVMFLTIAIVCLPIALASMRQPSDFARAFGSLSVVLVTLVLAVVCTLGAYVLMNRWQQHLPATEAGLIYGVEPVFASLFALFLPAWLSGWTGITYPNEIVTIHLVMGGGLILFSNVLIQTLSSTAEKPG